MTEVRTSSLCERPCAGIEETGEAPSDAGGMECSRRRKVHSLIDKVYDPANLAEAWKRVRENRGSAGIDGLTVAGFEQRQDELLERLHKQLREKTYRRSPVKRVAIPKLGGGTRNLGIPSVRDRVVQQALVQKMNPIFEPLFADCSFGYRPGRSPHMAMRKVWREIQEGNFWILDADLRAYFDSIDQHRLVDLICDQISDGRVLQLIRDFLEAGVIADGGWEPTKTGVPQGGVASPLWSNIFLTPFDHAMTAAGYRVTAGRTTSSLSAEPVKKPKPPWPWRSHSCATNLGLASIRRRPGSFMSITGSSSSAIRSNAERVCGCPPPSGPAPPIRTTSTPCRAKSRWPGSRIKSAT